MVTKTIASGGENEDSGMVGDEVGMELLRMKLGDSYEKENNRRMVGTD